MLSYFKERKCKNCVFERVNTEAKIKNLFAEVDWDFADAWTSYGLSLAHWYPTKLPPQVASKLIAGLTDRTHIVCDPFCGSGTVLAEAMRLGRRSIGVDISPIACMISKARTTLIPLPRLSTGISTFLERFTFGRGLLDQSALPLPITATEEDILRLVRSDAKYSFGSDFSKWFHPSVYRDICFATQCIDMETDDDVRLLLRTTVSTLLRTLSSQPRSWGYIADNVAPKRYFNKNVYKLLQNRLRSLKLGMQMSIEQCTSGGETIPTVNSLVRIRTGNARTLEEIQSESIDCIVTSPPYPNVSDNVTSQRLSLLWLGYDIDAIKEMEIGARWKRFRKGSLESYVIEMQECLTEMKRLLKKNGRIALILGSSPKRENDYPTLNIIADYIRGQLNMTELGVFMRKLPPARQHGSHGIMEENILVYRKK